MELLNSTHENLQENLIEGLPYDEIHRKAVEARSSFGKAQRALSFWLLEMERRKLYRHFGCGSVFHYAELYLELAPHTIYEYLRAGKEMEKLPLLASAFSSGKIASSKIREISRVATPDTEKQWLDIASTSTCRQLEKIVAITPKGGLPGNPNPKPSFFIHKRINEPEETTTKCISEISGLERDEYEGFIDSVNPTPVSVIPEFDTTGSLNPGCDSSTCDEENLTRYRRKLILDLENEQNAILSAALEKARKETGCRGKSELLPIS